MRVLLSAYLDHNLGDDLFVDYFLQRYHAHEIDLLCDDDIQLNSQIENHAHLRKIDTKGAIKSLHRFDALVILGGSIFHEIPDFYGSDYRRNALVTLFRLLGKKVIVVGCNIGPIHSRKGERISKYCLSLANGVSVRDSASLALLEKWGFGRKSVLAPDLVFSYPHSPSAASRDSRHRLGISVINLQRTAEEQGAADAYAEKLAEVAEAYLRHHDDNEIWLFGFDGGVEDDGFAIEPIARNLSMVSEHRIKRYQYGPRQSIAEFLDLFSSCDFIIGSRFHSVILALTYGIPFFPIAYSDKTINLLSDLGYTGSVARYSFMDELDVDFVVDEIMTGGHRFVIDQSFIRKSREHFANLDRYLPRTSAPELDSRPTQSSFP